MITNWGSKMQPTVTLSSTEAEYVALATCAQEMVFQNQLLEELGLCKKPGLIFEDNTGAIFLVTNKQVGARTKHIDVRHHFVREHVESGNVLVWFIKGEQNASDILTKNVSEALFMYHAENIIYGRINFPRENVKMSNK